MTNIFPTNYSTKWTPDWTDVVWSSDSLTNFNLTISSIALYAFTSSSTDNLSEWATNKYYSDTLVDANSTVVALWNDKADKTNVLEKDNTTAYTPTQQYHPATKEYVDAFSLPDATTTVKWKDRLATNDEVAEWTLTTTIVTPETFNNNTNNYWLIASNNLRCSADLEVNRVDPWTPWIVVKQIDIWYRPKGGTVKIEYESKETNIQTWRVEILIDDVIVDANNTLTLNYSLTSYTATVSNESTIKIRVADNSVNTVNIFVRNFRIYYDDVIYSKECSVIQN